MPRGAAYTRAMTSAGALLAWRSTDAAWLSAAAARLRDGPLAFLRREPSWQSQRGAESRVGQWRYQP
jgi:hypothetical protein